MSVVVFGIYVKFMMLKVRFPFHLVSISIWPFLASMGAVNMFFGFILIFKLKFFLYFFISLVFMVLVMMLWWRDVVREGYYLGDHSIRVVLGLRVGMLIFIFSELCFFVSFFWGYFDFSLSPDLGVGMVWPPVGVVALDAFSVPLLNTVILVSSGLTVTWAHHGLLSGDYKGSLLGLFFTIFLGFYFTYLQYLEYAESYFCLSDSCYGSIFFVATGFHGLHVLIGSSFLFYCFIRLVNFNFFMNHHFGFEAAAWYWHFVDVIWLFLFVSVYWWGF
uniref:Cytochrome c oxidase subunit 3 n=1 Tax=Seison sp. MS-2015 TaxID=1673261 RepID=A0A678NTM8_9BILA|nr:cytochrome c oxidase subunit III [Seison sp. MS-2015]